MTETLIKQMAFKLSLLKGTGYMTELEIQENISKVESDNMVHLTHLFQDSHEEKGKKLIS